MTAGLKGTTKWFFSKKDTAPIGALLLRWLPAGILVACLLGISSLAVMLIRRRSAMNAIGERND